MADRVLIPLLLTLGVILPACRKDHPLGQEVLPAECVPTPPIPMLGWNFQVPEHAINGPRFNPNDGDEILFVERPFGSETDYKLHRYRISTGVSVVVRSGSNLVNIHYPANWGSNGWMLINLRDVGENIFMMKDNGDSLTQLTSTSKNFHPLWSPEGNAFGYQHQLGGSYPVIVDLGTNHSDTVTGVFTTTCWYAPTSTVYLENGVWTWQMGSDPVKVSDLPADLYAWGDLGSGIVVLNDHSTALWMQAGGLYRTSLTDGGTSKVFSTCNSQYFVGLDYSPQTNKLVTTRITRTPAGDRDLRISTDIVLMNPDGSGQEVLNIPFPE